MQEKTLQQDRPLLDLFSKFLQDKMATMTLDKRPNTLKSLANRYKLWRFKSQLTKLNQKLQHSKNNQEAKNLLTKNFLPLILRFSTNQNEPFKPVMGKLRLVLMDTLLQFDSISSSELEVLLKNKMDEKNLNSLLEAKKKIVARKQDQIQLQKDIKELMENDYAKNLNEAANNIRVIKNLFILKKSKYEEKANTLKQTIENNQKKLATCNESIQIFQNRIKNLSVESQYAIKLIRYEKEYWSESNCYDMGYDYANCSNHKHSGYRDVPIYEADYQKRQQATEELTIQKEKLKELVQQLQPSIELFSNEIKTSQTLLEKIKSKLQKVVQYISQLEDLVILKIRWEGDDLKHLFEQVREKDFSNLVPLYLALPEQKRIHLLTYIIKVTPEPKFLCDFNALVIKQDPTKNVILTLLGSNDMPHAEKHYYLWMLAISSKDQSLSHICGSAIGLNYGASIEKEQEEKITEMVKSSFDNGIIRRRLLAGFQAAKDLPNGSSQDARLQAFWKCTDFRSNQKYDGQHKNVIDLPTETLPEKKESTIFLKL